MQEHIKCRYNLNRMQESTLEKLREENKRLEADLETSSSRLEKLTSELQILEGTNEARAAEYAALGKPPSPEKSLPSELCNLVSNCFCLAVYAGCCDLVAQI